MEGVGGESCSVSSSKAEAASRSVGEEGYGCAGESPLLIMAEFLAVPQNTKGKNRFLTFPRSGSPNLYS